MGKKLLSQEILAPLVNEIIGEYSVRLTVRQIYYRLVAKNVIPNTRGRYNSFDYLLTRLREGQVVDPDSIEDRTRETIGGDWATEQSPQEFLRGELASVESCWETYTLPLWASQESYIEVWVEKDALSSLVSGVCDKYRVLVFPCKGYSSFTKVWEAVPRLNHENSVVLYLGDHDPSGLQMEENLMERLYDYGASPDMKRIALTIEQINKYNLPQQPVKRADSRSPEYVAKYGEGCWELDALPPDVLQKLIDNSIKELIDWESWNKRLEEIEQGKEGVRKMLQNLTGSLNLDELEE